MKIIVHDLSKDDWQGLELRLREGDIVVSQDNNCDISDYIDNCGQLVFISRCVYGSFSPFIKGVLDKCKASYESKMELRLGQTHYWIKHEFKNAFVMICCFYGGNITALEEQSARVLALSNGVSLRAGAVRIFFYDTMEKIKQLNDNFLQ